MQLMHVRAGVPPGRYTYVGWFVLCAHIDASSLLDHTLGGWVEDRGVLFAVNFASSAPSTNTIANTRLIVQSRPWHVLDILVVGQRINTCWPCHCAYVQAVAVSVASAICLHSHHYHTCEHHQQALCCCALV